MRVLVVADSLQKLKPSSDTSLAIAEELLTRRHRVWWTTEEDLALDGYTLTASAAEIQPFAIGNLPAHNEREMVAPGKMDAILIRKDPPFDESYVRLCWMLCLLESKVFFVNRPSQLLRYHEKWIPLEALAEGYLKPDQLIPSFVGPVAAGRSFMERMKVEDVVSKPLLGHGGEEIRRFRWGEITPDSAFGGTQIVQPFQPDVLVGDRRVFFLKGKLLAHFLRVPPKGGFVSNLAQGGTGKMAPLSAKEKRTIGSLGKFLKKKGIFLAGADLIGHRVSEVNITSPTGLRTLQQLEGVNYATDLVKAMEKNAKSSRAR
jgi:glutathione synthase